MTTRTTGPRRGVGAIGLALALAPALASAQSRDRQAALVVRHASDDLRDGDADGAAQRLALAQRACDPGRCSAALRARIHVALGVVAIAQHDADATAREFAAALALDPHATLGAELASPEAEAALASARGAGASGGAVTAARHAELGDACTSDAACGEAMRCAGGSCSAAESSGAATPTADAPEHGPAAVAAAPSETWRFAIDAGGGLGLPWVAAGTPEYEEFREWDARGSGNFTCGAMGELSCPAIDHSRFGYEGVVVVGLRYNVAPRVGLGLVARFQPDAAPVGILPGVFIGARLYVALTEAGFVRRGLAVSTFVGSGVGQMQASPPGDTMVAHIISGLNNFHAGARLEYGLGLIGLGAELSLNFQLPNFLFVPDLTAFVSLHI